MLGKTAAHIFWMFRYLERCENTARLINASHFISLTQKQNIANHWDSILNVAGNKKAFLSKMEQLISQQSLILSLEIKQTLPLFYPQLKMHKMHE